MLGGGLFSGSFLSEGLPELDEWKALDDARLDALSATLDQLLAPFGPGIARDEAETEKLLIHPLLEALGWSILPQQKTSKRREDVPDGLLFADAAARAKALAAKDSARYPHALVVQESKAWELPLDRGAPRAPSSQALRYLRLAEANSRGAVRWAILTNGQLWRLYWHDARAPDHDFLEADLTWLRGPAARDALRSFALLFSPGAFAPAPDGSTLLLRALDAARLSEERLTDALSRTVFLKVYPQLLSALSLADPQAAPHDAAWVAALRDAALVLLYRLLFVLYAEGRVLLPVGHHDYDRVSIATTREELAEALQNGRAPGASTQWWERFATLCDAIDRGRDRMGLPPYNGGLFHPQRAPLLARLKLTDAAFAPILAGLSLSEPKTPGEAWTGINYRDLSVQQLGTIYEALLERRVEASGAKVIPVEDKDARHSGGVYYTRNAALVSFTLDQAVQPLIEDARTAFLERLEALKGDRRPKADRRADLERLDPAARMLALRVLDPAMGSGHFLVTLTDTLSAAIQAAMAEAADEAADLDYTSPLAREIEEERRDIEETAKTRGWVLDPRKLEDRQIVRRLVLKRVVHGVDLNPLAVELAKLSLWLHSFTVGAPLSFLDHHLKVGDSLLGAMPEDIRTLLTAGSGPYGRSAMFLRDPFNAARNAAIPMAKVENSADADIVQVHESQDQYAEVERATAPLRAFLDAIAARDLLPKLKRPEAKEREKAIAQWLDGLGGDPVALTAGAVPTGPGSIAGSVAGLLATLRPISAERQFLHWPVAFPNRWTDLMGDGGFDAVVGNPPYVRQEKIRPIKPALEARFENVHDGVADLYVYFFARALQLLRPGGRFAYVVNNKWLKADYAEKLRGLLSEGRHAWLTAITDFGHAKAFFPGVDAFPSVVCIQKPDAGAPPETAQVAAIPRDLVKPEALTRQVAALRFPLPRAGFSKSAWVLEPPPVLALMEKLRRGGVPLKDYAGAEPMYGVKTGFNEAFVVDQAKRDRLVADDARSAELLKPFLRGEDIGRWAAEWERRWMIFARRGTAIHDYPAVLRHLETFRRELAGC